MYVFRSYKLAPLREVIIKDRTESWMNGDILEAIKKKNKQYFKYRKNRDDQSWAEYKRLRNEARRLMDSTKKAYFNEKIVEHRNDTGKLWETSQVTWLQ